MQLGLDRVWDIPWAVDELDCLVPVAAMLDMAAFLETLKQRPWRGFAGGAEVVGHLAQARHRAVFHVKLPEERQQLFLAVGD